CRPAAARGRAAGASLGLVRRRVRSAGGGAADGISGRLWRGAGDRECRPSGARRRFPDAGRAWHSGSGLHRGLRRLWRPGRGPPGVVRGQTGAGPDPWPAVSVHLARPRGEGADPPLIGYDNPLATAWSDPTIAFAAVRTRRAAATERSIIENWNVFRR